VQHNNTTELKMPTTYYDAILRITEGRLIVEHQGDTLDLPTFPNSKDCLSVLIGKTGIVQFVPESDYWRFVAYQDQSLRRVYELDHSDRIGWKNDSKGDRWTAPVCIVPGEYGAFIEDDTEEVTIAVPPEFFDLCDRLNATPEQVLRAFVADAAEIINYVANPRADGYSSNGRDERRLADDYLNRVFFVE
jgi:hypothetical protein